ncbi:uridine kinase [candidate division KSB1 bacterium]|nr:uridine kinase [candidate division KSB1 bacterium]
MEKPLLLGIAGGSGSGKTLVARRIVDELGSEKVIIIQQDSYYKDLSHLSHAERAKVNFDHPDAFDHELLRNHLKMLLANQPVQEPVYDFTQHSRSKETRQICGHMILVLEGILILDNPQLRNLMDIKIFVDTDPDIRFIRRLTRDIKERGRTVDSVINQYIESVRPMHLQFVEPSKRYADLIIPEGGHNLVAIDLLKTKIRVLLQERGEVI